MSRSAATGAPANSQPHIPSNSPDISSEHPEVRKHALRNGGLTAFSMFWFGGAWSLKIETIMMPTFLAEGLGGSKAMVGLIPLLQRFWATVSQLIGARVASRMPRLGNSLGAMFAFHGLPWIALGVACAWHGLPDNGRAAAWLFGLFFLVYSTNWILMGFEQLWLGALSGKLIPARTRGRLAMGSAVMAGVSAAIIYIWILPAWFNRAEGPRWDYIFIFSGLLFIASAPWIWMLREHRRTPRVDSAKIGEFARGMFGLLARDKNFLLLMVCASLFNTLRALAPQFTLFGTEAFGLDAPDKIPQLLAQTTATAGLSVLLGPMADRFGNRVTFQTILIFGALTPLVPIALSWIPGGGGAGLFWFIFAMFGLLPMMQRISVNYVLEATNQDRHPEYLGLLSVFQLAPLLFAPAIGALIDRFSFQPMFIGCSLMVGAGFLVSLKLREPRHKGYQTAV